jgi:hypothetical protein
MPGGVLTPDGSGDFAAIPDAVDVVVAGDVIELASGPFTGERHHMDLFSKTVTVRSQTGSPEKSAHE